MDRTFSNTPVGIDSCCTEQYRAMMSKQLSHFPQLRVDTLLICVHRRGVCYAPGRRHVCSRAYAVLSEEQGKGFLAQP